MLKNNCMACSGMAGYVTHTCGKTNKELELERLLEEERKRKAKPTTNKESNE